jgi:hypothetical protein
MIAITVLSSKCRKTSRLHGILTVDFHMPGIHSGACSGLRITGYLPDLPVDLYPQSCLITRNE